MKQVIGYCIERANLTIIVFVALLIVGALAYVEMDKQEDPQFEVQQSVLSVSYPGATSVQVEEGVTNVIEDSIQNLGDINEIFSYSYPELAIFHIILEDGSDVDSNWDELEEVIDDLTSDLPVGTTVELNTDVAKTAFSIVNLIASDDLETNEIEQEVTNLSSQISKLNGTDTVDIFGLAEPQIHIELDVVGMNEIGLTWQAVQQILETSDLNIPEGNYETDNEKIYVNTNRILNTVSDFEEFPIAFNQELNEFLTLGDIAEVKLVETSNGSEVYLNGTKSVSIVTYAEYNLDARSYGEELRNVINEWENQLPESFNSEVVFDQSQYVEDKFFELYLTLLIGMVIVSVLCFITLSIPSAIVTTISIPLTIISSLFFLNLWGVSFHQISLAALILVLGIIVDDSIVTNENIERLRRNNDLSKSDRLKKAIREVSPTIIVSTLTIVVGFAPLYFLEGDTGNFIRSIPQVIIVTLIVSSIVALFFVPAIRKVLKDGNKKYTKIDLLWDNVRLIYKNIFSFIFKKYRLFAIGSLVVSTAAILLILTLDIQFFPRAEERNELIVDVKLPEGSDKIATEEVMNKVYTILNEEPGIDDYFSVSGDGLPRIYYNENPLFPSEAVGQILLKVNEDHKKEIEETIHSLTGKFNRNFTEERIVVRQFEQGPPTGEPVQIRVTSDDLDELRQATLDVSEELRHLEGVYQVQHSLGNNVNHIDIGLDVQQAASSNVNVANVMLTNRFYLEGIELNIKSESAELTMLNSPANEDFQLADVLVPTQTNEVVELGSIAEFSTSEVPSIINHYNSDRAGFISAYVHDGTNLTELNNQVERMMINVSDEWSSEILWSLSGQEVERSEVFDSMYKFFALSIFIILILIYMMFKSVWKPFIIMTTVYMAFGGGVLGLFLFNQPLGFMSLLGLIGLSGIIVRNGMMLVEFIEINLENGHSLVHSIEDAGVKRLRPILITAITAVGGLLPLAISGGSLWTPLAIVIISGVIYSTTLTLFVIPMLYYWIAHKRVENKLK